MTPTQTLPETPIQTRAAQDFLRQTPARGRTLLLVEDSRQASDAIRLMFQGAVGRLRRVDSLTAARRHLSLYLPDAVLIDLGLPDGSGLDLIADLAASRPRIPLIIAMSGQPDLAEHARAAGADRFLAKPFDSVTAFRSTFAPFFFAAQDAGSMGVEPKLASCALRDDLYLALDLLCGPADTNRRDYALQFTATLSRMLRDPVLSIAVTDAQETGSVTDLALLLRARLCAQPLI